VLVLLLLLLPDALAAWPDSSCSSCRSAAGQGGVVQHTQMISSMHRCRAKGCRRPTCEAWLLQPGTVAGQAAHALQHKQHMGAGTPAGCWLARGAAAAAAGMFVADGHPVLGAAGVS
jgi:hypothetical protein